MTVLAALAGILIACAVYLLLSDESWRRLAGLTLIGNALPLLVVAAGVGTPASIRIAIAMTLAAFALFLAYASFVRIRRRRMSASGGDGGGGP